MTSSCGDRLLSFFSTSDSHAGGGTGQGNTFRLCGRNLTAKSFYRLVVCVIFFNAIVATVYFIPAFSVTVPQVMQHKDPQIHDTKEHKLDANLMGVKRSKNMHSGKSVMGADGLRNKYRIKTHIEKGASRMRMGKSPDGNTRMDEGLSLGLPNAELAAEMRSGRKDLDGKSRSNNYNTPSYSESEGFSSDTYFDETGDADDDYSSSDEDVAAEIFSKEFERNKKPRKKPPALSDVDHPQYSMGFPKNTKPLDLLNWTRSNESLRYFQPIDQEQAWVYSGYFDDREDPIQMRVLGISQRNLKGSIYCYYYGIKRDFLKSKKGRLRCMKDGHRSSFSATEVLCPVTSNLRPIFVRLSFNPNSSVHSNEIKVQYRGHQIRNFTVCFPPLHSNYNQSTQIVQTIELSRVLGADHFIVYNFSLSNQVDVILQWYQTQGLLTILQWPLPTIDLWYYGQVMAINDCLYRNMGTSKYVVISDADEVIVPHIHLSWTTLLNNIPKHSWQRDDEFEDPDLSKGNVVTRLAGSSEEGNKRRRRKREVSKEGDNFHQAAISAKPSGNIDVGYHTMFPSKSTPNILANEPSLEDEEFSNYDKLLFGSFSFRCVFFTVKPLKREQLKDLQSFGFSREEMNIFDRIPKCPMVHLMRTDTVFEQGIRSKTISRPELVVNAGIHKIISHIKGYRTAYVEPEIALLHHYRDYKVKTCNTLDMSALNFKDNFFQKLKVVVEKFSFLLV